MCAHASHGVREIRDVTVLGDRGDMPLKTVLWGLKGSTCCSCLSLGCVSTSVSEKTSLCFSPGLICPPPDKG